MRTLRATLRALEEASSITGPFTSRSGVWQSCDGLLTMPQSPARGALHTHVASSDRLCSKKGIEAAGCKPLGTLL
jgi:hypothetical protein